MTKIFLLLFILTVYFFCDWTWSLLKVNVFIVPVCILLTYFLLDFLLNRKISYLRKFMFISIALIFLGYLLLNSFDKNIFQKSELDYIQIRNRYQFFSNELHITFTRNKAFVFYLNKVRPTLSKYLDNEAKIYDIETYFPSKFSLLFLPFAFVGLLYFIRLSNKWILSSFFIFALAAGFTDIGGNIGPVVFYILITSLITLGAIFVWKFRPK